MEGGEDAIDAALREEQKQKKAKKAQAQRAGKRKGMTLEEVERLEGGTVKESQVGMAHTKRAARRKEKAAKNDTEILPVDDLVEVEEALELEEDDGVKLEPFNLAQERQEGHFDESGNYVENTEKDEDAGQDAWLASDEAKVVSEKVRRKIEAQQARVAQAEAAPEMTSWQVADLQRSIASMLQRKETVPRALKRLRPVQLSRQKKGSAGAKVQKTPEEEAADKAAKAEFDRLTEAASTLMDVGELNVYTQKREDFEREAAKFPVQKDIFGDDDGEEDMFAEAPSRDASNGASGHQTANPAAEALERHQPASTSEVQQQQSLVGHCKPSSAQPSVDYSMWPVKELRRLLQERGIDVAGMVEKGELVDQAKSLDAASSIQVPAGYVFDQASSYYFSSESGMYWDAKSGSFYSPDTGKWNSYVGGQFVELPE